MGAPGTPTPTGRTFLLAAVAPRHPTYSPLILPLGMHSHTLSTFGGGPGTVGLHGWPDPSVFGHAVSHGCVRVPPAALAGPVRHPPGQSGRDHQLAAYWPSSQRPGAMSPRASAGPHDPCAYGATLGGLASSGPATSHTAARPSGRVNSERSPSSTSWISRT